LNKEIAECSRIIAKEQTDLNNPEISSKLSEKQKQISTKFLSDENLMREDLMGIKQRLSSGIEAAFNGSNYFKEIKNLNDFYSLINKRKDIRSNYYRYYGSVYQYGKN
jgi:hypothetical protein